MNVIKDHDQIVVDRRPLWIVVCDRLRREIFLLLMFAVFAVFLQREGPADLSPEGYKTLCVFALCISLWATNLIPLSITSLLAIAVLPLVGATKASLVYSYFGNKAVFFILGAFILSGALMGSGLSSRISLWVLDHWGATPQKLITTIYILGAAGSCLMSEHAVAAMLFPIVMDIAGALKLDKKNSPLGRALFLSLAWGCVIGGTATVLGGGRVPLTIEILEKSTQGQSTIGLIEYTWLSLPLVAPLFLGGWWCLHQLYTPEIKDIRPAHALLHQKSQSMGRMTFEEKGIAAIMILTLIFWFGFGAKLGIANIALISIAVLFVFNLTNWKMIESHVNWPIILMYGGAISLGQTMSESGAAVWLAKNLFAGNMRTPTQFLVGIALLSVLLTTFMSNSAVIAVLIPPSISLSAAYEIPPPLATMAVVLPSNFDFLLPIAAPAMALAYSSRYVSIGEMIRSGAIMCLVGMACYGLTLLVFWPLMGFVR